MSIRRVGNSEERHRDSSAPPCRTEGGALRFRAGRESKYAKLSVVVERDPDTGLYVGTVPGWPGAHSQGGTLDELERNLREVIEMLLEDGE